MGYLRPAPGTWGSLAALAIWWWLSPIPIALQLGMILVALTGGVWAAGHWEAATGHTDPSEIVIDEVVGMWIALAGTGAGPMHLLSAFLLFRLFDIWKPGPIDRLQKWPGGWGVMLDDVLAGLFAWPLVFLLDSLL